jgi:hypothetical protein
MVLKNKIDFWVVPAATRLDNHRSIRLGVLAFPGLRVVLFCYPDPINTSFLRFAAITLILY